MNKGTRRVYLRLAIYLVIGVAAAMGFVGGRVYAAPTDQVRWSAEITVPFTLEQIRQADWRSSAQTLEAGLKERLSVRGAGLTIDPVDRTDQGVDLRFGISGTGNMEQFTGALFDDAQPIGGLIGGPARLTLSGQVSESEQITLTLESNPSTGYGWRVESLDSSLLEQTDGIELVDSGRGIGGPGREVIRLRGKQEGLARIILRYVRPWDPEQPNRRISVLASQLGQIAEIVDPSPATVERPSTGHAPDRALTATSGLPASWDWRARGKLTPVRNQGSCGSCWAFSTVGAFEADLLIQNNLNSDLSEQYLVSCNTNGWGCGGGWFAHDFHIDEPGKNQTDAGAVLENAFPYSATNGSCTKAYPHSYELSTWQYVNPNVPVPSVDEIKDAIYTYGPVSAAVCAGNAWANYKGGVFTTDEKCNGIVNHAIVLVGWNDSNQTWILRNSWGQNWGDSGYMQIKWGISNVGYNANYVVGDSDPLPPICYSLATNTSPAGGGTVTVSPAPDCNAGTQYSAGTSVQLTANPAAGYGFVSWTGVEASGYNPMTLTMDGNKSATANVAAVTLLQNPGMENDDNSDSHPDNWTLSPKFTQSSTVVDGGSYSGQLMATDNKAAKVSQVVRKITGGTGYHFSGRVNIPDTADTFTFKVLLRWRDSGGRLIRTDTAGSFAGPTAGWTTVDQTYSSPLGARSVQVMLAATSLKATIYVDSFAFEENSP